MRRFFIPVLLFFLVVLEGVALDLLPASFVSSNTLIVSHWVFVFLILLATFFDESNTYLSVIYAVIFGLLIDIVYTDVLGVYMFAYAVIIYIVQQLTKLFHANFYTTIIIVVIGISLVDISIYLLYSAIGNVYLLWGDYAYYRLLPTVLANIIFFVIIYPVMKNRLILWSGRENKGQLFRE